MAEIITNDRISELPECIIHHIMSFLKSPKNLVRMSVLSKKWFGVTAAFPILHFSIFDAEEFSLDKRVSRDYFFKYVDYTTTRFCEQNAISAHTFSLCAELQKPSERRVVNKCLQLILTKGVQVLDMHNFRGVPSDFWVYCLPDELLSASSLTSLKICRCQLPSSSLMLVDVKFKSLKFLEIEGITINEEVIKRLTTSCPLLEEFNVINCEGFKTFCVYGLEHLQMIEIFYYPDLERIDIEAPNLWSFILSDSEGIGEPCMNLASFKKLTAVTFLGYTSNGSRMQKAGLLSNFPFVKDFSLTTHEDCNKLKLSSNSLTALMLHSQCDFEDIEINTPNLLLFRYMHDSSLWNPWRVPDRIDGARNLVVSKPRLECYPKDDIDTLWFLKLKRFLEEKNAFKVLKLHISTNSIDVEELKAAQSQPYELEHVELVVEATNDFLLYVAVVDAVLWCCRPQSLTLVADYSSIDLDERKLVVKSTHEKLLQQEDHQGHSNIQAILSSSSKAKTHFSDLDSLLTALSRDQPCQKITFVKEKVVRETGCL